MQDTKHKTKIQKQKKISANDAGKGAKPVRVTLPPHGRAIWYGWKKDAAAHFDTTTRTIEARFKKNEINLLKWLKKEKERRDRDESAAIALKNELLAGQPAKIKG